MKKIVLCLFLFSVVCGFSFAFGENDDEFTWADYEALCYKYNVEPSYEKYEELVKNPQCLIIEDDYDKYIDVVARHNNGKDNEKIVDVSENYFELF